MLALVLYAARDRRRRAVAGAKPLGLCALGLVLIGVVVLLLRWLGGAIFDAALNDTVRAEGATGSIWSISTSALATEAYFLLIGIGALVLLVALALGRWLRHRIGGAPLRVDDEETAERDWERGRPDE